MTKYLTSVHFPNPDDKSVGVIQVRAMRVGNYIVPSPKGENINIELTGKQAREIFDRLTILTEERMLNGEHPFPSSYRIFASNGIFTVDSEFLEDVCGSLLIIMVENELGSLMQMYQPDGSYISSSVPAQAF